MRRHSNKIFQLLSIALLIITAPLSSVSAVALRQEQPQALPNAAPDLIIESLTIDPPNAAAGTEVTVTAKVKNQGDAAATGGYQVHLYIDPPDNPPTSTTPPTNTAGFFISFGPGAINPHSWTRTVANANPKIYVWVDRDNKVAESNETNNIASNVTPALDPDAYDKQGDNTCADAEAIATDNSEQQHTFVPVSPATKDEDWVKFDAVSGVEYVVQALNVGSDADAELELRSTCTDPPSFGSGVTITFTAPTTGAVFIRVQNGKDKYGANTEYKLRVKANSGCANLFEPNNACSLAGDLSLNAAPQEHNFCAANDVDWTKFEVTAGATYVLTSTNTGANANVQMSLYGNCDSNTSLPGGNGQQTLRFTAPSAGFLYLKTENLNPNLFGTETKYTLQVGQEGQSGCAEDSFEQDDNSADAKLIASTGVTQTRNACPAGDQDWIKFDATSGVTYTIETLNLGVKADTVLCLYDKNSVQIKCDDDSGAGYGSRIVWSGATGNYFLRVKDYDPQVAGTLTRYDLRILTTSCVTDALESDNALANALPLSIGAASAGRNICPAKDNDWVKFDVSAGSYMLETFDVGPEADTVIELFDASEKRLSFNDDHTAGAASRLAYNFATAGTYFARISLYNTSQYGAGTEYSFRVKQGSQATPTPTPNPTPQPTPTPQPGQTNARTLILVNRTRLAELYSEASAGQVMDKLNQLAANNEVKGQIVRLDNNTSVANAYAAWLADQSNIDKANQVATAIRQVIMTQLAQFTGIEYVVLVGEDRAIPFRRVRDNTPQFSERTYKETSTNHPTGAALAADYFLTDDYYVDREPTQVQGREIYLPDLSIGRLIEKPNDIIGLIDKFLAAPVLDNFNVLVSGWDFVQDAADLNCQDWKKDLGDSKVDCAMIGSNWPRQELLNRQTSQTFKVQSINGHANHYAEGTPGNGNITGTDIVGGIADMSGGIIYTLACHSGLNVPDTNAQNQLDLAEAFARKQANYIGNTGYGWGLRGSVGLSEKLMRLYTGELLKGAQGSMGKALVVAKNSYFQQDSNISAYDEKVIQELIYYGLPMFRVVTGAALSGDEEFPGVIITGTLPTGSFGDQVITTTLDINFATALGGEQTVTTPDGQYIALNDHVNAEPGEPVQPLFFGDVTGQTAPARDVVLRSATFNTRNDFNPVVASPYNEFVTNPTEAELASTQSWYPDMPVDVTYHEGKSTLVSQLGQYNAESEELRLYQDMQVEVYYSTSTDETGPEIVLVDGVYNSATSQVLVKVGATDASEIKETIVSYIQDASQASTSIRSINLNFDASSQKWVGSFTGDGRSRFFVQVVDKAGNVTTATNKGNYYAPAEIGATRSIDTILYLPVIQR